MIDEKPCVVCAINDSVNKKFFLCDSCDDAYHWDCLNPPITEDLEEDHVWVCPDCQAGSQRS